MGTKEIIREIKRLPLNKRLLIVKSAIHSIRKDKKNGNHSDIDEQLWLTAVSANPVFDFLKDEEDLYSLSDGKPIKR